MQMEKWERKSLLESNTEVYHELNMMEDVSLSSFGETLA